MSELYRMLSLTSEQRERIEAITLARLHRGQAANDERAEELRKESSQIKAKQDKLIEAYYANAIPRDLFERTQKNLRNELAQAQRELAEAETTSETLTQRLSEALDLLQDAHSTYQKGEAHLCKQLNQALFARVLLGPDQVELEFTEHYEKLISDAAEP